MIAPVKITSFIKQQIEKDYNSQSSFIWRQQFFPSDNEKIQQDDFIADPLQEEEISPLPRLFHKYPSKILINTIDSCPVYCRFCTRKRYIEEQLMNSQNSDKQSSQISRQEILEIANYIKKNSMIHEVIFSGGEVFSLSPKKLEWMIETFIKLKQLNTIRFHTRMPIVEPKIFLKKISTLEKLQKRFLTEKREYFILIFHINHSIEITEPFKEIIKILKEKKFILKSQSVLLKNINNNIETLDKLFKEIYSLGIEPYYLHHLDKVKGAVHFFTEYSEGISLINQLKAIKREYPLPRYVRDSKEGKKPVSDWFNKKA